MRIYRAILFLFFVSLIVNLTGCGLVSKEPEEVVESTQANEEDKFLVDNIEIEVLDSNETSTGASDEVVNEMQESTVETQEPVEIEVKLKGVKESLSEEDAVYMDLLLSSDMTDEELEAAIMQESAFQSIENKENLVEQAKAENQSLSENPEENYIDMGEDEDIMRLIKEAQAQMVGDQAKAEPISLE